MPDPKLVKVGDVIQLDPAHCDWGPLLAYVDEVRSWGVTCTVWIPGERGGPVNEMPMRVEHGRFVVIGELHWLPAHLAGKMGGTAS